MPRTKPTDQHHLRQRRISATGAQRPVREVIERAKLYVEDRVWLSPVELKATLDDQAPVPGPTDRCPTIVADTPAPPSEVDKPTHVGLVLGLKGRGDYEAQLFRSGTDRMTDQNGRSFDLSDYGYDADESYRLDLSSLREL